MVDGEGGAPGTWRGTAGLRRSKGPRVSLGCSPGNAVGLWLPKKAGF